MDTMGQWDKRKDVNLKFTAQLVNIPLLFIPFSKQEKWDSIYFDFNEALLQQSSAK